jgi:hypothetical protein
VGGCEIVFDHMTGIPVCADLDCGSMALYECDPLPCDCLCDPTIPPEVLNLQWSTKVNYGWDPAPCAVVYNVYRNAVPVPALPGCGPIACAYGTCLWSALVATTAFDLTVPPSGLLNHYLITGENHIAEGIMGFPSAPLPRPNLFSCPSPPPPPPLP